jgi:hypothetical protein
MSRRGGDGFTAGERMRRGTDTDHDDLAAIDALAPRPVAVRLGPDLVPVLPVTLSGLRAFRRLAALAGVALSTEDTLDGLAEQADELTEALARTIDVDPAVVRAAPLDEVFLALCAALRVNADFLAGPVSRALAEGTAMLMPAEPAAGAPSSPGSSAADIP